MCSLDLKIKKLYKLGKLIEEFNENISTFLDLRDLSTLKCCIKSKIDLDDVTKKAEGVESDYFIELALLSRAFRVKDKIYTLSKVNNIDDIVIFDPYIDNYRDGNFTTTIEIIAL